ncbi:MAG: hypothetical protein AUH92_04840 [Acidobacteria bacterium 13_1_40CM_4_69_4]|nr:MAG: hypothetical protein AUH92_04840 [Acidobacteria bacterium 13_1_40CM_4_69_4]
MAGPSAENRGLLQEIYLQDLVLSLYRVYAARLQDPEGRRLIEDYLHAETDRGRGIERCLSVRHVVASSVARALFSGAGRLYGRLTSRLGTRIMLRIALSASERASKRACALLGDPGDPEIVYLSTLRARNEGELLDALRQHLIDTAPRRG